MRIASIASFPLPAGIDIVQDVGPGTSPTCAHDVVVPDGGLVAPPFCIPVLGFTAQLIQSGCGTGRIASLGGADFTVAAVGDTSDSLGVCNLPHPGCPPGPAALAGDGSFRADVTVGDGAADTCGHGTANAVLSIPTVSRVWLAAENICPDPSGTFDPSTDTLVLEYPQVLDLTTDAGTSRWSDLDGDGCALAGAGPLSGRSAAGTCLDLGDRTLSLAAAGVASAGPPMFDIAFSLVLDADLAGPSAALHAVCASPPAIDFDGAVTRCFGAP